MSLESPTKSVKQRLLEQQGQKAPLDLFLFACWEQEKTLKALAIGEKKEAKSSRAPVIRGWPGVLGENHTEGRPQEFASLWAACCQWYKDQYPELANSQTLDHEALSGLVGPVIDLYNDLCGLFYRCNQKSLPFFPLAKPAKVLGGVGVEPGVEGVETPSQEESPWPHILQVLDSTMGSVNSWVREYLVWTFREEVVEFFEPGSRPPVGKFAPPMIRKDSSFGSRPRGREGGREGREGGRDRGGDRGRGRRDQVRDSRPVAEPLAEVAPPAEGAPQQFRGGREQGRGRGGERPKSGPWTGDRNRGRPQVSEEETKKNTDAALAEVDQAMSTLAAQPNLKEIRLAPQNSFYRRIQHQKIVDAGFISQSVGEGPSRSVTISRQSAE